MLSLFVLKVTISESEKRTLESTTHNIANKKCLRGISMIAIEIHCDINTHDIAVFKCSTEKALLQVGGMVGGKNVLVRYSVDENIVNTGAA